MQNAKWGSVFGVYHFAFCIEHFPDLRDYSDSLINFNLLCLVLPQAEAIASQFELERVAEGGGAETANLDAGGYAHLEDAAADFIGPNDANHATGLADIKVGRYACHADFLMRTITRIESSSRKQSLLP
jgi:hypothetical protein